MPKSGNNSEDKPTAILLMGPTAAGKTDLAIYLAQHLPVEIISVDSVMIYRGMDIGSAKPSPEELALAPHRLLDILDPAEAYSAADFCKDALREMEDITARGHIPLLVGGTMLYFRALLYGLSELPAADAHVRSELEAQAQQHGWAAMHTRLAAVDPQAAARIHPNDPQRIQRALEVYEVSGTPMTEWYQRNSGMTLPYDVVKLCVSPADRAILHERIAQRFKTMLEMGFIPEVEGLYQREDLDLDKPAMRAVGYRQVWEFLAGKMDYNEMVDRGIIATRQLAKRQYTWLRSEKGCIAFDSLDNKLNDNVLKTLQASHII